MKKQNKIYVVWFVLFLLTLISASLADSVAKLSTLVTIFICTITIFKGHLVIDYLMDLRFTARRLRWMMLGYLYVFMPVILFVVLSPDSFKQFTTL